MARLFYKMKHSFVGHDALSEDVPTLENYMEKVTKLIPSEIIVAYLLLIGMADSVDEDIWKWIVLVICFVLTPVYLNTFAKDAKPKRNHLILSTIAFLVWAYAISGDKFIETFNSITAAIILIVFSLISAVIPLDK